MAGLGLGLPFAIDALDQLVARRRAERLQDAAIQEQIRQFNLQQQERSRAHDLQLRQQDLNEGYRQDQLAQAATNQRNIENERQFRRGVTISDNAMPGDIAQPEEVKNLETQGLGGMIRTKIAQDPYEGVDPSMMGGPDVTHTGVLRGGSKWLDREAQRKSAEGMASERLAQQGELARDRADRERDRDTATQQYRGVMAGIAGMNAQTARMGAEQRVQAATEKQEAAAKQTQQQQESIQGNAREALRAVNDLLDAQGNLTGGAQYLYGWSSLLPVPPGGAAANAEAARDQLVSRLTLDELTKLRQASKTGGALGNVSDKDVALLSNAASRLKSGKLNEAQAAIELKHIRDILNKVAGVGGVALNADDLIRKYRR